MEYRHEYQVNKAIDDIANSVLSGEYDVVTDVATLTYYGMKIRGGLDKLHRQLPMAPTTIGRDIIYPQIDKLKGALNKISELIKSKDGLGSLYFSELTDDEDLARHPYVKLLGDYKIKGMALPKAISMTSISTGIPELSISNFVKLHDIKYPVICETSTAYIKGQDDARRLVGTNLEDVGIRMHEMQMKYLKSQDNEEPNDVNSYIAGFSSMLGSRYSQSFLKGESDKAKLLANK